MSAPKRTVDDIHRECWELAQRTRTAYVCRTRNGHLFISTHPPATRRGQLMATYHEGDHKPFSCISGDAPT